MKAPDEIKKGLEMCGVIRGRCKGCPYDGNAECVSNHSADALAYIQQLEEDRKERDILADAYQELEAAQPKWISVKERLPERAMKCLVRSKAGRTFTTWYDPEVHRFAPHFAKSNITHWMHLPCAPKEEA